MTNEDQIKLIDDMIKENPDSTIKDFLELVKDIDRISSSVKGYKENNCLITFKIKNYYGKT